MTNYKIALIGNPNSGKTTLFNLLTGSHQKVGNFAGVTVERKSGEFLINESNIELIDLPGTYSIYPKTEDESITTNILLNHQNENIQLFVVVCDATNLYRNLLFFTQIYDLKLPIILVLNMIDELNQKGTNIQSDLLLQKLNIPIVEISARKNIGIETLKSEIEKYVIQKDNQITNNSFFKSTNENESYKSFVENINNLGKNNVREQTNETVNRYEKIAQLLKSSNVSKHNISKTTQLLDKILLHKLGGYVILFAIFILIFQAIFSWAQYPMDLIDNTIQLISAQTLKIVGDNLIGNFLTNGLIVGLGSILIFIPQIALLFLFLTILEESGYMARVVFLVDFLMRKIGLNGKSIISLLSGAACAIPAIMSARNISNKIEKLITIFITPLISCSARIPVYTIMISTVVPSVYIFNFFHLQAVVMIAIYVLGFLVAFITAFVFSRISTSEEKSLFVVELPTYRIPILKNIWLNIKNKVWVFVTESGKIILIISIILWGLSNFSLDDFNFDKSKNNSIITPSQKLENSFAGQIGKIIEPVFAPLGFDWKIDIAIITSFAAREVFVSTLSTIYSVDNQDEDALLRQKLLSIKDVNNKPFFNLARGVSIVLFFAFALQCMSTIAISRRETNSWKIPILQFVFSFGLAYLSAYLGYISFCE